MKAGLTRSLAALVGVAMLLGVAASHAGSKQPQDPSAKLRAGIQQAVADPARAAKMLAAVDEIEALVGELNGLIAEERSTLATLLRDFGSSRADVDDSLARFNARRDDLARRVLTVHAGLKAQATDAEWKKLHKLEMEMVTYAASRSLGQGASSGKES